MSEPNLAKQASFFAFCMILPIVLLTATSASEASETSVPNRVNGNLVLLNDNGAWCWYQDERAIVDELAGKLLVSSVAASIRGGDHSRDGNVDLVTLDLATGRRDRVVLGEIEPDDHNVAALLKRPDGRYLAVYANHNTDRFTRYRVSVHAEDASQWTPERIFDWSITPGNDYNATYSNLYFLAKERRVYNFVRVNDRSPNIMVSDDLGDTWRYGGQITQSVNVGYVNGYFRYASNGVDRIDLIATEAHPRDFNNGIYHAYIQDGKLHKSDGSVLDTNVLDREGIPATNSLTPVFLPDEEDGSQERNRAWTTDLAIDDQGHPYALFTTRTGDAVPSRDGEGDDRRLYYARYDGHRWHAHEVAKMGRRLFASEQDYTGLGALVPGDPTTIYISTPIQPTSGEPTTHHEIYRGVTSDGGGSWRWTAITENSAADNLRPLVPTWNDDNRAVLWMRGTMRRSQRYDFAVVGLIERASEAVGKVQYVDASRQNTTTHDSGEPGASHELGAWKIDHSFGNDGGTFVLPKSELAALKSSTTVTHAGTYDLFAYFWGEESGDCQLRAGLSIDSLLPARQLASQAAEREQFLPEPSVETSSGTRQLYRTYVGRVSVEDGDSVTVYIDGDPTAPNRPTAYDGIGYARVD